MVKLNCNRLQKLHMFEELSPLTVNVGRNNGQFFFMNAMLLCYAPINGLPQDGGGGNPRGKLTLIFQVLKCQFPHP